MHEVQLFDAPVHVAHELLHVKFIVLLTQLPFVNVWFESQESQLEARGPEQVKHELSHCLNTMLVIPL